jgi:DNA polymerase IIIc chi subunit
MKRTGWIDVDLRGLERLLARRGKEFIIHELVQNAWDEQPTIVTISLPRPRQGRTRLLVTDDSPPGLSQLE